MEKRVAFTAFGMEKHTTMQMCGMNRWREILCPLILLTALLVCQSTVSFAGDWRFTPKFGMYGGYDNNVFFEKDNKVDSTIINIQPAFELDYTSLLSTLEIEADFDILRYIDESDLNRVDQNYKLFAKRQMGERWTVRGGLRYKMDSTQNTYLEEIGRLIEVLDRDTFRALGGISYAISTVSWIDTEYQYEKAEYEDDIYPDYSRHRLDLRYRHRLKTQQDYLSIGPSFYHRANDLNDTDYVSLDLGWERDWSDITNTFASIGARYTDVEYDNGEDRDDWGARAKFNVKHLGLASKITFRYYHDLKTTADGTDVNVDNFFLQYKYMMTERFGLGIDGRLILSYDLFSEDEDEDNSRYYEVRPFLNYRMTENLNAYLRYSYQNSSQDLFGADDVRKRNRIWLEFKYAYPMAL